MARIFKWLAIAIALFFLGFGLVRMGIGAAMFGYELGWWTLGGEFAEVLPEARDFLAKHASQAIFPWSVSFYFALIFVMGVVLSAGAWSYLRGARGKGLALIAVYLALHGGMFLNYQLINPKIWLWAGTVAAWVYLYWWHQRHAE